MEAPQRKPAGFGLAFGIAFLSTLLSLPFLLLALFAGVPDGKGSGPFVIIAIYAVPYALLLWLVRWFIARKRRIRSSFTPKLVVAGCVMMGCVLVLPFTPQVRRLGVDADQTDLQRAQERFRDPAVLKTLTDKPPLTLPEQIALEKRVHDHDLDAATLEHLMTAFAHYGPGLRCSVAANPNASAEMLKNLSTECAYAVANHQNTTEDVLRKLTLSDMEAIRRFALSNLAGKACDPALLDSIYETRSVFGPDAELGKKTRGAMLTNPCCPSRVFEHLKKDPALSELVETASATRAKRREDAVVRMAQDWDGKN